MPKWIIALCTWVVLPVLATCAVAAPIGFGIAPRQEARSPIIEARVFCYNRFTGRFKHWGACHAAAPRVYCRSRYGEFLHWGAC